MSEATVAQPNPLTASPGNQGGNVLPEQELSYEDAMEEGATLAMEEVQERLDAAGLEMDAETGEIIGNESAFDPDPRPRGRKKGRGKKRSASGRFAKSRHHKYGQFRYMDPAPRRFAKARSYARRAKDPISKMLDKAAPFASILGATGVFYAEYKKRATALGMVNVVDAITADVKNFDLKAATDRVVANAGSIITPAIVGYVVKQIPVGPSKIRNIMGNAMMGGSGGLLAKHLLDPPIVGAPNSGTAFSMAQVHGSAPMNNGVPTWGGM